MDHRRGDLVKARIGTCKKYNSGRVTRVNEDDTYAISFDDGKHHKKVKKSEMMVDVDQIRFELELQCLIDAFKANNSSLT